MRSNSGIMVYNKAIHIHIASLVLRLPDRFRDYPKLIRFCSHHLETLCTSADLNRSSGCICNSGGPGEELLEDMVWQIEQLFI